MPLARRPRIISRIGPGRPCRGARRFARRTIGYTAPFGARIFVSYDLLYRSDVLRPGNQIDAAINFTGDEAIAAGVLFSGAPALRPLTNGSAFWTQRVTFGAAFAF
ncbi:MAG TPA: BBP7 family outer membrane beta-barrel protein [Roseiarcus sp.]|nr:BBP7 family outer membrane beta-barrel protein [Roseiarcus sp.]